MGEGETDKVIPPADCHILEISTNESVITIHVYGKRLEKFKVYIPTEEKKMCTCMRQNTLVIIHSLKSKAFKKKSFGFLFLIIS